MALLISDSFSWLYTLILSIDANFRLKLKDRGIKDPELGSGWAYFVETDPYMGHLDTCEEQAEVGYRGYSPFSPQLTLCV